MRRIPSERSPISVLLLTLLTCGLYYFYWLYQTSKDLDDLEGPTGELSPGIHLLLFILTGSLWGFAWDLLTARRVVRLQQRYGLPVTDNTVLYLVLDLLGAGPIGGLGLVTMLLEQTSVNEIYRAALGGGIAAGASRN